MISPSRYLGLGRLVCGLTLGLTLAIPVVVQAAAEKKAESTEVTPAEQAKFDKFLDNHPEIADALIQHPGKADGAEFLKNHPAYATFIKDHPKIAASIKAHPREFVEGFLKREDDTAITKTQAKDFGDFLKAHPAIEQDLAADPAKLKNAKFVQDHPELHEFLDKHPGIAGFAAAKPVRLFVRAQLAMGKTPN
jgi:hypothetical protein